MMPIHFAHGGLIFALICAAPSFAVEPVTVNTTPVPGATIPDTPTSTNHNLSLEKAIQLALRHNPTLAAAAKELKARQGLTKQAELLPNPSLAMEIEDFGGRDKRQGFDAATTTISVGQLIELGGKRGARMQLADWEQDAAMREYEMQRLDLIAATHQAYVALLHAQAQQDLEQELAGLARKVQATVAERVKAGKVSPLEESRAGILAVAAELAVQQAAQRIASSRNKLSSLWGESEASFNTVAGRLDEIPSMPSLAALEKRLAEHPQYARWTAEISARRSAINLEQAKRIPDVTIIGGVRQYQETDDNAFVVGISVPLPLFDRNQGNVAAAASRLTQAQYEQRAAEINLKATLATSYRNLVTARSQIEALRSTILPTAQKTFELTTEGYGYGKFGYLEMLDSQRTLFDARGQYLSALAAFHEAYADLERLTGESLSPTSNVISGDMP